MPGETVESDKMRWRGYDEGVDGENRMRDIALFITVETIDNLLWAPSLLQHLTV